METVIELIKENHENHPTNLMIRRVFFLFFLNIFFVFGVSIGSSSSDGHRRRAARHHRHQRRLHVGRRGQTQLRSVAFR